jgi:hypothetical protein
MIFVNEQPCEGCGLITVNSPWYGYRNPDEEARQSAELLYLRWQNADILERMDRMRAASTQQATQPRAKTA